MANQKMIDQNVQTASGRAIEFTLPDAAGVAAAAIEAAFEYAARKLHVEAVGSVPSMLRAGRADARGYFDYALARELAEHIGALDEEVQAVYLYDPEATAEDAVFAEFPTTLVHLVIWARRKTNALASLLDGLDRAVAAEFANRVGSKQTTVLDCQVVDDAEVNSRTGFGTMLAWVHNRPLMVWKR